MNKQGHWTKNSFSLIEMIVTLAIIGLLTITILPTIGRYSRANNVTVSAQTLREALNEARSYAVSPDPTNCTLFGGVSTFTHIINQYAIYIPAPGTTGLAPPPVYDPNPGGLGGDYECGGVGFHQGFQINNPPRPLMTSNQYAIMARHIDKTDSKEYNVGIVRIGSFDAPATAATPIVGGDALPTMIGFSSPSGSFFASAIADYNYTPASGKKIITPSGPKTTTASAAGQYTVIGLADDMNNPNYQIAVFVHNATGQVTSDGSTPSGFD